jgi:microcystin-dependent protein
MEAWDTPDEIADSKRCYRLFIPDDEYSLSLISGAILLLARAENWSESGDLSPDEAADRWLEIFDEFLAWRQCMVPGSLFFWGGQAAPGNGLLCDGSEVAKEDYPALYEAIGDSWGTPSSGDNFVLPDARGAFLFAEGNGHSAGETGGAETHQLSIGEIPAHAHSEVIATNTAGVVGEIPAPVATPLAGNTGSTGGGGAHNNMPPYLCVPLYIVF